MGIDCRTVRWSIPVSDQHSGTCVQIIYYLTLGVLGAYKLQLFAGLYFYIFDDWTNPEKCLENSLCALGACVCQRVAASTNIGALITSMVEIPEVDKKDKPA
jgi:hypothetical protein